MTEDTEDSIVHRGAGILVLCDMAAFGCHMDKFYYKIMMKYEHVYVDREYECFECFLLNTRFFQRNEKVQSVLADPFEDANNFISWEEFYEKLLEEQTRGTTIKYSHGSAKFRECWIYSCDDFTKNKCNEYIQQKCPFYLKGNDKFEELLKDTAFKKYLTLRKNAEPCCNEVDLSVASGYSIYNKILRPAR